MHRALTIAGSDSGAGAGIQADLKTFATLSVYGTTVITAVTAQNTLAVIRVHEVPPEIVAAQMDAVLGDIGADAAKTGMLGTAPVIEVVAGKVAEYGLRSLVVDPVMVATSGRRLLGEDALRALIEQLFPRALVVTPNLPEAATLVGQALADDDDRRRAARQIAEMGPRYVVLKGGHLGGEEAIDLLWDGREFVEFSGPRIGTRELHGTGCTFAAAITAFLAKGAEVPEAVGAAKQYVARAIAAAMDVGKGSAVLDHTADRGAS